MSNVDILEIVDGKDWLFQKSDLPKAANVLSVQLGSLEYAPNFGVDLSYFLNSDLQFQNESFNAYLVERLLNHQINVVNVTELVQTFYEAYTFSIGESPYNSTGGQS